MELMVHLHPNAINLNSNFMETKALVDRSWDEIVFENRNKDYGAYVLRKSYSAKVGIGLFFTLCASAILLSLSGISPQTVQEKIKDKVTVFTFTETPTIIQNAKIKQPVIKVETKNDVTKQIRVVTEPVTDLPIENDLQTVSTASTEGDAGQLFSEGTSTGSEITSTMPVIDPTKIYTVVEVMPQFEGGMEAMMKFLQKKLRYPNAPRRLNIEGTVYVSFIINGDGSIRDVMTLKGVFKDLDAEAVRVISLMPLWKGGKQGGVPVPVKMVLPIKFSLNN